MKKSFLIGFAIAFFCFQLFAQKLEVGLVVGGANYQGDLASSEFKVLRQQINLAYGGFLRYHLNESFAIRLQVLATELSADDARSSFDVLQQRNLRFFSPLTDISFRAEWYPFVARAAHEPVFLPYLSLGASFFSFNPQAEYEGRFYELQPLRTEGQGLPSFPDRQPYQLYSASVLGGIGFKFLLNDDITLGIDFSGHYTFTDYLDDVSSTYASYEELAREVGVLSANIAYQVDDFFDLEQTAPLPNTTRGNPDVKDLYFVLGVTLSYNIINPYRSSGKGIGCPSF